MKYIKLVMLTVIALTLVLPTATTRIPSGPSPPSITRTSAGPAGIGDYTLYSYNISGGQYDEIVHDATGHYGVYDGVTYVVGEVAESGSPYADAFIAKFNADGQMEWYRTWGTPSVYDVAYGVCIDTYGYIWVTGNTNGDYAGGLFLLKYNSTGGLLVSTVIDIPGDYGLVGYDVTADFVWQGDVNGIYVTGFKTIDLYNKSIILFKFRQDTGAEVWNRTYNYEGKPDKGMAVIASWDANGAAVTVGGYVTNATSGDRNAVLLRYDKNGNLLWSRVWGSQTGDDMVEALGYSSYTDSTYLYGCGVSSEFGSKLARLWAFDNNTGVYLKTLDMNLPDSVFYDMDIATVDVGGGSVIPIIHTVGAFYNSTGTTDMIYRAVRSDTWSVLAEWSWDSGHDDIGYGVAVSKPAYTEERYVLIAGRVDYGLDDPRNQMITQLWSHDTDSDGLCDLGEHDLGTSYTDPDSDNDGMPDGWEVDNGLDPLADDANDDLDNDGLQNYYEYTNHTQANNNDTDSDDMPDGWEVSQQLNPLIDDSADDPDNDGLTNVQEFQHSTLPRNNDTDSDDMPDGWEVTYGLNPLANDSADDPDSDGLTNYAELLNGTKPNDNDTDDDGMPDGWELDNSLNATDSSDATSDPDSDALTNYYEYLNGTSPNDNDTDDDGIPDGWEVQYGLDPLADDASGDVDNDGMTNLQEYQAGTDPTHDQVPPTIASVNRDPPVSVTDADTVTIYVDATDHNGIEVVYVEANYTGTLVNYTATYDSTAGAYKLEIPAQDAGVTVMYRAFVRDLGGNWASTEYSSYTVIASTTTGDETTTTSSTTESTTTSSETTTSESTVTAGTGIFGMSTEMITQLGILALVVVVLGAIVKAVRR
ncbi:MAG: hypothetical protein DRO73_04910 [Candidatus Thorarchaeota archaeon]|nr:MAG: hypothetical protein DRO73_04910 [Candidatus Thorarchaeota archaeon]